MSILLALVIGSIIGGVAGFVLQETYDLLVFNILVGIVGAIIGSAVYFFAVSGSSYLIFSWGGFLSQVAGALIAVVIFSALHRAAPEEITIKKKNS